MHHWLEKNFRAIPAWKQPCCYAMLEELVLAEHEEHCTEQRNLSLNHHIAHTVAALLLSIHNAMHVWPLKAFMYVQ